MMHVWLGKNQKDCSIEYFRSGPWVKTVEEWIERQPVKVCRKASEIS